MDLAEIAANIDSDCYWRLTVHDTGFGKINDSLATSSVIYFAETSLSVILPTLKCVATHRGERVGK